MSATGSSLRYEALTGQYVFTWATDRAWAGTSRQLVLNFRDGTQARVDFALTR